MLQRRLPKELNLVVTEQQNEFPAECQNEPEVVSQNPQTDLEVVSQIQNPESDLEVVSQNPQTDLEVVSKTQNPQTEPRPKKVRWSTSIVSSESENPNDDIGDSGKNRILKMIFSRKVSKKSDSSEVKISKLI